MAEARVLGSACRWVVLGFVVLMAMDELQLAPTAVRTLSTAAALHTRQPARSSSTPFANSSSQNAASDSWIAPIWEKRQGSFRGRVSHFFPAARPNSGAAELRPRCCALRMAKAAAGAHSSGRAFGWHHRASREEKKREHLLAKRRVNCSLWGSGRACVPFANSGSRPTARNGKRQSRSDASR